MYDGRLTQEDANRLHTATLQILDGAGVRFREPAALEVLKRGGCRVLDDAVVQFPPRLVEWALSVCPKTIELYDRNGRPAITLRGRRAYFGNGSDLLYIIDHTSRERRKPRLKDVENIITVLDALPNFDFVMSGFIPDDIEKSEVQPRQMLAMLDYTTKPIVYVTTDEHITKKKVEMAETVAGGPQAFRERPFAANYINISNPLKHNAESIRKLMWLSEKNLPFIYRPSIVTRGISTPVTWAGFLAVNNAAGLAGLVLSQLIREGAPFIRCGCGGGTFDMRSMVGLHAAAEIRGFNEDIAEQYQLPRFGIGGLTGAKVVDQQAAYEAALTLVTSAVAGAQLIHDVGYMDNGTTGSLEQLLICNEIIGWVRQYMKEMVIDEETLALDVIADVVKRDADFLQTDHTLRHFGEDYYPQITERLNYSQWKEAGSKTLRDRAQEQVDQILANHEPPRLPAEMRSELLGQIQEST